MIFLQASIAAGAIIFILLGILLLTGTLVFTGVFMKLFWRISGKETMIKDEFPYYKDPLLFFSA